ncbi:MAG: hypothetical protein QOJ58_4397 [Alphaproteobacteria bacterium]|jgi:hypothetical protein|nr:hypothetical protein [Alphaproteobacteria bacterium]
MNLSIFPTLGVFALGATGFSVHLAMGQGPWFGYVLIWALAVVGAVALALIQHSRPQESAHRVEDNKDSRRYKDRKRRDKLEYRLAKRQLKQQPRPTIVLIVPKPRVSPERLHPGISPGRAATRTNFQPAGLKRPGATGEVASG